MKRKPLSTEPPIPPCGRMLIFTAHRRENLGEPMRAAFLALRRILQCFDDVFALCPLHPNPEAQRVAREALEGVPSAYLIDPPELVTFHHLLSKAYLVITDSGGIQEEAAALGIPTLVTRRETEREEGVRAGVLRLVGTKEEDIFREACALLSPHSSAYAKMRVPSQAFGDGRASRRIADTVDAFLKKGLYLPKAQ